MLLIWKNIPDMLPNSIRLAFILFIDMYAGYLFFSLLLPPKALLARVPFFEYKACFNGYFSLFFNYFINWASKEPMS